MKILFITQDYAPKVGGIETYCTELTNNLSILGYTVDVICPTHKKHKELSSELSIKRIPIHSSFLFLPLLFLIPFFLYKKNYTHIIYGQWQNGIWQLFYPFIAKKYKTYTLVHGRELLTSVMNPFTSIIYRRVFKSIQYSIPNSHAVKALLEQKAGALPNSTIVHPGTNTSMFFPMDTTELRASLNITGKITYGVITRQVKRKNVIQLISILPQLKKEVPDIHLLIGGTGPELDNLKKAVQELNVQESVTFLGFIPDNKINEYFNAIDIFTLPSLLSDQDIEGFGIVYIESSCCGKPVIGNRCGGVTDAIEHNKSGILCEPGSDSSLMNAISTLAKDSELRKKMGNYGRERALKDLTWQANAQKIVHLF